MKIFGVFLVLGIFVWGLPAKTGGLISTSTQRAVRIPASLSQIDKLIQKNCEVDLSEIELLAISSGELTGMLEKEQISGQQLKIEDSANQQTLTGLAEGCAEKIHQKAKIFVEVSRVEAKLVSIYKTKIRLSL